VRGMASLLLTEGLREGSVDLARITTYVYIYRPNGAASATSVRADICSTAGSHTRMPP